MLQTQGVKGEAVLGYCELLTTQEMRHHTAFPKGKKQGVFMISGDSTFGDVLKNSNYS